MIGVGILGAGFFGAYHARAIAHANGVQLVAVRYARPDREPVLHLICPYGTLTGGDGRA